VAGSVKGRLPELPADGLGGFATERFQGVQDEFSRNFSERGELGASFAVVHNGRPVVDLWGGVADPESGLLWTEDTVQVIFSGTKGLVGLCVLMLVDRGAIDPDERVASYWPEFGACGKSSVRVRDVLSHQASLPALLEPVTEQDILDDVAMAEVIAGQPQESDPRARDAYHPLTYGWMCGELIRRVDGRSVGKFLQEEVVAPLDLEIWLGLPEHLERRVATLSYGPDWGTLVPDQAGIEEDDLATRVWFNPPLLPTDHIPWNSRAFHAAEIPGGGAIGTARSFARLYGCLADGGELDGLRLLSKATIDHGTEVAADRLDPFLDEPQVYGLGFELQNGLHVFGPPREAFGYTGAGGSVHGAWLKEGVGFSYCMNEMRDDGPVDARARALLRATYRCLG
jgi:CubicO group peptidase (beta-lactamase class C family)